MIPQRSALKLLHCCQLNAFSTFFLYLLQIKDYLKYPNKIHFEENDAVEYLQEEQHFMQILQTMRERSPPMQSWSQISSFHLVNELLLLQ